VWQPTVAVGSTNWRPYSDGYWAYTDQGWTWVSYEDFGWATYHYGRWVRLRDRGWFWVPGYTWAPAWVSWRTGGDYIGWAPLPPDFRDEVVYEGRPVYGYVDAEYDIGPAYYNFVDIRYIGEPVLRERIFEPFVQGPSHLSGESGSAGLGLAIARAIVEVHGGHIWLADSGPGTRIRFKLPAGLPDDP
jgi:hypothetical protein